MSFYLRADESVGEGIKRIVSEEIAQAIKDIDNPKLARTEAIHEVRKHCKKIRGLLRLVRPQFEDTYRFENAWFRDTAQGIAQLRDADALIETYDSLLHKFSDQVERRAFAPVRRALTRRRQANLEEAGDLNQRLEQIRSRMQQACTRVEDWQLEVDEFAGIEGGLVGTYRRARKAMRTAYDDPTAANFHEWRKQIKYHGYHVRVLRDLWKPMMSSLRNEADALSDLMGDDHNLDVFYKTLLHSPKQFGRKRDIQVLLGLIDRRSAELRIAAKTIGARIFAQNSKAFGRRFRAYWEVWRSEAELPSKKLSEEPAVVTAAG
jgi:CHAD domain-containing protein